jgi:hypothetical protein
MEVSNESICNMTVKILFLISYHDRGTQNKHEKTQWKYMRELGSEHTANDHSNVWSKNYSRHDHQALWKRHESMHFDRKYIRNAPDDNDVLTQSYNDQRWAHHNQHIAVLCPLQQCGPHNRAVHQLLQSIDLNQTVLYNPTKFNVHQQSYNAISQQQQNNLKTRQKGEASTKLPCPLQNAN